MNHFNKISKKAFIVAAGLAISGQAHALGLGDANVQSYLNQPLNARIDLLNSADDDLASVTAKLGSAADYELIGASMESVSVPIRFSIENIDGDAYILATSDLPMTNPIVRLIVEVDWSSGRMLREYTLFLDPASIASTAPAPQVSPPGTSAPAVTPVAPPPVQSKVEEPASQVAADSESAAPVSTASATSEPVNTASAIESSDVYGPVQSGENLWRIATDWSEGSGLDVNKVMLAIQRENPQAFMRNNINLLKRGAILRMPALDQVEQLSTSAAMAEVQSQTAELQQRATEGTVTSASTPLLAQDSQRDDPSAAPVESTADSAAPGSPEPDLDLSLEETRDQLELVPPSEASELDSVYGFEENPEGAELTASDNVTSLRENLARTEEDLINEQQQNEYLQQQLEELEQRLNAQEAEATAKAAELAAMEQRLKAEREAAQSSTGLMGLLGWLVAIGVGIAVLFAWLFSRRSRAEEQAAADAGEEALRDITDEAEEVLKVLDDEPAEIEDDAGSEPEPESESAQEPDSEAEDDSGTKDDSAAQEDDSLKPARAAATAATLSGHVDDAEVLDEDSSDPEIQLDLARAYISMGDKEAARVILDEVMTHGSEEQKAEAQAMREQL